MAVAPRLQQYKDQLAALQQACAARAALARAACAAGGPALLRQRQRRWRGPKRGGQRPPVWPQLLLAAGALLRQHRQGGRSRQRPCGRSCSRHQIQVSGLRGRKCWRGWLAHVLAAVLLNGRQCRRLLGEEDQLGVLQRLCRAAGRLAQLSREDAGAVQQHLHMSAAGAASGAHDARRPRLACAHGWWGASRASPKHALHSHLAPRRLPTLSLL